METNFDQQQLARLRWGCRRGMLELDLMLLPFFDNKFLKLTVSEQHSFSKLLEQADTELFRWLINQEQADVDFINIIQKIRQHFSIGP